MTVKKNVPAKKVESLVIIDRTPEIIAVEILSIDQQARQYMVQSAIDIGVKLTEAKSLVAHGEWTSWLKENVNYSQSTAGNFMRVAEEYQNSNSQTLADLSYTQAVALLSVPAEEREAFAEENNVIEMSTRELQATIKEKQEVERLLKEEQERLQAEQKAHIEEIKQREALYTQYQSELTLRQKIEADLAEAQEEAKKAPTKSDAKTKVELRKAEKELSESQQRITALEAEMKAQEEEISSKVAEQLKQREAEFAELSRKREEDAAKQIADLQEQLNKNNNTASIKVKVSFDALVGNFKVLLASVAEVENEEEKVKFQGAISKLCDKMKESL